VSFQQRFNRLMAQEQFSAPGLIGLLKDQVEEVTQGAATPGIPQLNRNGIVRLAIDLFDQSVSSDRRGTAASGYRVAFPNDPLPARAPRATSEQVAAGAQASPPETVIEGAREAIRRGANRDAVRRRLIEAGVTPPEDL
jgi:hypothetical protein